MAEIKIEQVENALSSRNAFYIVRLLETDGSTPRDAGAIMLVGADDVFGTIGGGSAEWVAVQSVRRFIDGEEFTSNETITLGPEIDQCCGGIIEVCYELLNDGALNELRHSITQEDYTKVLIFGAGHTGLALANALSPLMSKVEIVDSRSEYIDQLGQHVFQNMALPEAAVRGAPKGTIFIVATHDHSLDFLVTAEALSRNDASYVGMIGSPTKRAVLKSWMTENGYDAQLTQTLHCPIGGTSVRNKRPEFIAAMTVAEILQTLEASVRT